MKATITFGEIMLRLEPEGLEEIRLRAGDEVIITAYELYDGKIMGN